MSGENDQNDSGMYADLTCAPALMTSIRHWRRARSRQAQWSSSVIRDRGARLVCRRFVQSKTFLTEDTDMSRLRCSGLLARSWAQVSAERLP